MSKSMLQEEGVRTLSPTTEAGSKPSRSKWPRGKTPEASLPRRALVLVDLQEDFCEGGSLSVPGGRTVVARCGELLRDHAGEYVLVVASRDWHLPGTSNGGHISAMPDYKTTWPVHCVQGSRGASYGEGLPQEFITHHVVKGMGRPAYSACEGEEVGTGLPLERLLKEALVEEVDVVGLALDHCVAATALDLKALGYEVRVLASYSASLQEPTATLSRFFTAGVKVQHGLLPEPRPEGDEEVPLEEEAPGRLGMAAQRVQEVAGRVQIEVAHQGSKLLHRGLLEVSGEVLDGELPRLEDEEDC